MLATTAATSPRTRNDCSKDLESAADDVLNVPEEGGG